MVAVARNIARFFKNESCGQCTPCREGSAWVYKLLCRIERGDATSKDLDLLLEISGSQGIMPGTTICGLADGTNWATRTIVNKYRNEFEARVRPALVSMSSPNARSVRLTVGAGAR
jgi:NADH-quinone oxidoreductase subunit F